jgi:hypothetical protein
MATPQPSDATPSDDKPPSHQVEQLADASPPGQMRDRDWYFSNREQAPRIRAGGSYISGSFTFWQEPLINAPNFGF